MFNIDFYSPTRIVFEKDRFAELDQLVPLNASVLITSGRVSAKKSGLIDRYNVGAERICKVAEQLKAHGMISLSKLGTSLPTTVGNCLKTRCKTIGRPDAFGRHG